MITESVKEIMYFTWKNRIVTAKDISENLKLEKSTVSRAINRLKSVNLILPTNELSPSSLGGRKTIVYGFNKEKGYVLGLSVEQDGIEYVKTNLFGEVVEKRRISRKISLQNICKEISEIVNLQRDVIAVGISVPGIVKDNKIIYSEALDLHDFDVVGDLSTDIPVFVEKDAICGGLRYSFEKSKVLYFQLSVPYFVNEPVGFGAGLIIDGKPYYGSSNLAGESKLDKSLCQKRIPFDDLKEEDMDPVVFEKFLDEVSKRIGIIASIFDPEILAIGGNITSLPCISKLVDHVKQHIYLIEKRNIEILLENGFEFVNAKGAAINSLIKVFTDENLVNYFYKKVAQNG
ncbi:MAG TPA: ROK family transcriptional regulator [Fervidobacterium sp.]|jgi:predicted NBD/HSP70 family sugar kinase|nr:ROK family transcriptional regulator [Fervidobacterium sp.]HOA16898.1 ROK family transcriptional regulator [Fervidobacterium sp.]HOH53105.1 ROK family transcriptional regulator [Fervidobacterium sp.]HOK33090.1 ROK family transcriptional regulator [Fervidobacterium sp.]HOL03135.1 ROK family transcriptional regulator [Fervidobacterium sp.]